MLITLVGTMAVCIALNIPAMQHYTGTDYPAADVLAFQLSIGGNAVCDKLIPVCKTNEDCTCETKEVSSFGLPSSPFSLPHSLTRGLPRYHSL